MLKPVVSKANPPLVSKANLNARGAGMIELLIALPALLMILFGITEFGRAMMSKNIMAQAAREGARLGSTLAPWDTVVIENRVNQTLQNASISNTEILISPAVQPLRGDPVTVTVNGDFTALSGTILPGFSGTVTLSAQSVCRYDR